MVIAPGSGHCRKQEPHPIHSPGCSARAEKYPCLFSSLPMSIRFFGQAVIHLLQPLHSSCAMQIRYFLLISSHLQVMIIGSGNIQPEWSFFKSAHKYEMFRTGSHFQERQQEMSQETCRPESEKPAVLAWHCGFSPSSLMFIPSEYRNRYLRH